MKVNLRRMTFSNTILDHVDFAGAEMNGAYFNNVHTIDIKKSFICITNHGRSYKRRSKELRKKCT